MGLQFSITLQKCHLSYLNIFLHIPYSESPNTHILYIFILSYMPLSFHSYFLPFYSLWFNLDSFYCCVLLPSSFILQCLVSCVINPDDCSFQYYIFQFQKSHLFICPSFPPCLFLLFIKHIDISSLKISSASSIISAISEADLNDYFFKMCYGLHFSPLEILRIFWLDVGHH